MIHHDQKPHNLTHACVFVGDLYPYKADVLYSGDSFTFDKNYNSRFKPLKDFKPPKDAKKVRCFTWSIVRVFTISLKQLGKIAPKLVYFITNEGAPKL